MTEFKIGNRLIGNKYKPLVIAEIGINHNGSLKTAKQMVDAAARAGAEVIKHQTHIIADEMSPAAKNVIPGNADISIYEIMESCALNERDERELKTYVETLGMIFLSTPFSRAAADLLEDMGVQAYKIGSGECNNYPLVEHIAKFGKPIILSTGMNTLESVAKSVAIFHKYKTPYALLHCTNVYPTPHELIRLGAMTELQNTFPDAVIGLSDHSLSNNACLAAVALGASIVERHFTDHMNRQGPDIICSMDEEVCKELIIGTNEIFQCLGGRKGPVAEEQPCIDFAFATVVTIQTIKKGEVFTQENIWVKRPGTGEVHAEKYTSIIGQVSNTDMPKDQHLCWQDIR